MHSHEVKDADKHFIIDPITMGISKENDSKNSLMFGDHNAEIFTFEIPKKVENHDMSSCNHVQVHYINISTKNKNEQSKDVYEVKDLKPIKNDAETLTFSWMVSGNATKYAGDLNFRILFACTDDENNFTYKKWTDIYTSIKIKDGFENSEAVVEQYADVLEQWKKELEASSSGVTDEQIAQAVKEYLDENGVSSLTLAKISEVTLLADGWVGSDSLYSQIVTINGVTANSQVDLTPSVEQLAIFYEKDLTFVTENENGTVTVYAIGQKPTNDYTIQVTITEVAYE